ncbi:16S rRNA (cytosine(1402)-N(4))-methyltransferase RsmH [Candidatus Desantisbacteria bacterium]|nr:16S rRNA (cytosine(1402)-N(4))-methyltransferase RsmH [Candidatus Desantisbacteria bacterium]
MTINYHIPIFREEILAFLNLENSNDKKIYVDATMGDGGHTYGIASYLKNKGRIITIDKDSEAVKRAKLRLKNFSNIIYVHDNYENLENILKSHNISKIDGIIFDLGVSSFQLDSSGRGFSFSNCEPLDMRMNPEAYITARDLINTLPEDELSRIIREFGEEKWSGKIAREIIKERIKNPINDTALLVEIIKRSIPRKFYPKHHVATKTFQALRIAVNQELVDLENVLIKACSFLNIGGRICVISFHSLEDRIVKKTFRWLQGECICPPRMPVCGCNPNKALKILTSKVLIPSEKEIDENPRSRSARLRVGEKIGD